MALTLTADERTELERRVRSRKIRAEDARRAQVILMLADGESFTAITAAVGCYPDYISRWKQRFETERLAGLQREVSRAAADGADARAGSARSGEDAAAARPTAARTGPRASWPRCWASATCWSRACGAARASSRIASSATCSRTIREFEEKAADVIGLYLNPPQHAVVFAADEKTAIQALDRLDPVLPLSPGRAERHGFEYYRHGTLSLYAALNTSTGEIIGQTVPRHTSAAFVEFLGDIVATQPRRREIHVIVDNLSAHKTKGVQAFLEAHPRVHLHFTPTYASWLNQVELWFAKIERDLLARGHLHVASPTWRARSAATSRATTRTRNRSAGPTAIRRIELLLIQLIQSTRYHFT